MPTSVHTRGHGTCTLPVEFRNGVLSLFHNFLKMNNVFLTVRNLSTEFSTGMFHCFSNYSDSLNSVFISCKKSLSGFSVVPFSGTIQWYHSVVPFSGTILLV